MNRFLLAAVAIAAPALAALAATADAAPLRADHPLIGTWKFAVPGTACTETLTILPSGVSPVTSGEEVSESVVDIDDQADASGFYKWVDTVTKTNGKPDCGGGSTPVGDVATNYVHLLDAGATRFAVCLDENAARCYGPYVRQAVRQPGSGG